MSTAWQVQEAKNRFSEVIRRAIEEGPQSVTRHGREVVVVVDAAEYRRLTHPTDFKEFLRSAPLEDVDLERSRRPDREVDLP